MFLHESLNDINEREKKLEEVKDTWKEYEDYINEKAPSINHHELALLEFIDDIILKLSMAVRKIDKKLIGEDVYNHILESKGQFYIDDFNKNIDDFRNKKVPEVYLIQPNGTLVHLINSAIKYNRNAIKRLFDTKHTNKYKRRYKRR